MKSKFKASKGTDNCKEEISTTDNDNPNIPDKPLPKLPPVEPPITNIFPHNSNEEWKSIIDD